MAPFDPYYQWLGIPLQEQPASHYRLLGIPEFDGNVDIIKAAAEQRTIYLRTLQSGEHEVLVAELLNEVSQARVTLLSADQKAEYDEELRKQQAPELESEPAREQDPLAFAAEELAAISSRPTTRSRSRSGGGKPFWKEPWAIPAGAGGIVVLSLLMWLFGSGGTDPKKPGKTTEKQTEQLTDGRKTVSPLQVAVRGARDKSAAEKAIAKTHRILRGHFTDAGYFDFSPDGTLIASAGKDHTIGIWQFETEELVHVMKGHTNIVTSIVFSKDGKRLATGGQDDGTARIWDVHTGTVLRELVGHDKISSIDFSPDGRRIAVGNWGAQTINIWNPQTGEKLQTLRGHTAPVTGVVYSPDGKQLVSGSDDDTANVWNTETAEVSLRLSGHTNNIWCVAFSQDGTKIATGSIDGTARIWDSQTGKELLVLNSRSGAVGGVAISPDGQCLVTTSGRGIAQFWSMQTGNELLTMNEQAVNALAIKFSPDGRLVAYGTAKGVNVWRFATESSLKPTANTLPASLQQGLIAYYPFNGNAQDESGNGNHGKVEGPALAIDRHGNTDQAYLFDGVDDYIKCPTLFERLFPLAVAAWFKTEYPAQGKPDNHNNYTVFSKPRSTAGSGLHINIKHDRIHAGVYKGFATSAFRPGIKEEWHHLTYVRSELKQMLFLDGQLLHQEELKTSVPAYSQNVLIGREMLEYDVGGRSFRGDIDDIRIYNRALSAAEVKALYDFEKP